MNQQSMRTLLNAAMTCFDSFCIQPWVGIVFCLDLCPWTIHCYRLESPQLFTIFKAIQFVVSFSEKKQKLITVPASLQRPPCHNLKKEIFEDDQVPSLWHGPHTKASCRGVARERSWDRMHSSWDLGSLALDGWWAIRNRETNIWCVKDWVTFAITLDHFLRICRVSSTRTYLSRGQVAAAKSAALWLRTLRPVGPCSISEFTRRRLCQPWPVPGPTGTERYRWGQWCLETTWASQGEQPT